VAAGVDVSVWVRVTVGVSAVTVDVTAGGVGAGLPDGVPVPVVPAAVDGVEALPVPWPPMLVDGFPPTVVVLTVGVWTAGTRAGVWPVARTEVGEGAVSARPATESYRPAGGWVTTTRSVAVVGAGVTVVVTTDRVAGGVARAGRVPAPVSSTVTVTTVPC
jgi:hypothetical protein